ncbi:hypothetical protein CYY_010435, partial [Polysphondylium violaceum]
INEPQITSWLINDEYNRFSSYIRDDLNQDKISTNDLVIKDSNSSELIQILSVINEINNMTTPIIDDRQQQQQQHFNLVLLLNINYNDQYDDNIISIITELKDYIQSISIQMYSDIEIVEDTNKRRKKETEDDTNYNINRGNLMKQIKKTIHSTTTMTKIDQLQSYIYNVSVFTQSDIYNDMKNFQLSNKPKIVQYRQVEPPKTIPTGVIGVHFIDVDPKLPFTPIPNSVIYLKIDEFNKPLSEINFPPYLKFLSLGRFSQFIYRNLDIPSSVTHLEIDQHGNTIDNHLDHYAYHWLFCKGTLPRNVTHLKIIDPPITEKISTPILIPSSVKYLDFNNNINYYNIQIIDENEYYKEPITKESFNKLKTLKSVKFPKIAVWVKKEGHPYDYESYPETQIRLGIQPIITTNLFPKQLESLDNSEYKNQFDTSLLPSSLTSLTCWSSTNVPNHCNLHYLSVYMELNGKRMIFNSPDNKPITQDQIPQSFSELDGQFTPDPQIPFDELYLFTDYTCAKSVLVPKNNIIIKKLVCFRQDLPLPDSVEYYRAYVIPHSFPSSLKTIHITSFLGDSGIPPSVGFTRDPMGYNWLHSLPPTVKKIVPLLDYSEAPMFPEIVDELLKDKYKLNYENNSINDINSIVSNDNFLKVWRNELLKNHIYSFIQPKLIQFVENQDNNNNIVFNFTESFCSNHIKLRTRILCIPPNGVTYYSVASIQKKEDLFVQLPSSIKKLRIDYQGLSKVGIPPSLKHLILKSQDSELILKEQIIIPSNIEILEFGNTCFGIQDLKKLITPNIKH